MVVIPLRDRSGVVVAEARVDDSAVGLASLRWYRLSNGYAVRTIIVHGRKRMVYLHRAILGAGPDEEVDHIDGDRLNNQRANLRVATRSANMQNRGPNVGRHLPRNVYPGRRGNGYRVQFRLAGQQVYLGTFATVDAADSAARSWRAEHMPGSLDARSAAAG